MARPARALRAVPTNYAEALELKTSDEDPRFNTALARGLAILRCFQLDEKMLGNVEIAERTGIPKPTVSRLTYTLTTLGYLHYRPEYGRYELAAGVVGLAYPYLVNQPVPPIARPLMLALAQKTATNIGMGVRDGLSVLYLEYALGEKTLNRRQRVGFRVPLVRTAMGRACAAAMRPEDREHLYARIREYYPIGWKDLRAGIEDCIARYRVDGYCTAIGTFGADTASVAVPFVEPGGREIFVFNSTADIRFNTPARLASTGKRLIALVAEVEKQLGGRPSGNGPSLGRA